MRIPLTTTAMMLRLVTRSLGFSPTIYHGVGGGAVLRPPGSGSIRPAAFITTAASPTSPPTHGSSSKTVRNMVLRPDWEREGRVYGLRMPPERTAERAFEYLVDYPCEFEIKVIGINEGSFADDIAATVSAVCEVGLATGYCL